MNRGRFFPHLWTRRPSGIFSPAVHGGAAASPYILLDNFTGSGAITDHLPDVYPAGSSYTVPVGTFANLSGGYLPYTATHFGKAIISVGTDDYLLEFNAKFVQINDQEVGGVIIRSDSGGTGYRIMTTYQSARSKAAIYTDAPGGFKFDPDNMATANYHDFTMVNGSYYTWKVYLDAGNMWIFDANDNLMLRSSAVAKTGQNYLGPHTYYGSNLNSWDYIKVSPVPTIMTFNVMGDSISNGFDEWPGWVACGYNGGLVRVINHCVAGCGIFAGAAPMDTQTDQCEADLASYPIDFTILAIGNAEAESESPPDCTAEYQENLIELYGTLGKPIYCMGTFDWLSETGYQQVNDDIQTAISNAVSQGVNATYWDTGGWLTVPDDLIDGIHPNATGEYKIGMEILDLLP